MITAEKIIFSVMNSYTNLVKSLRFKYVFVVIIQISDVTAGGCNCRIMIRRDGCSCCHGYDRTMSSLSEYTTHICETGKSTAKFA